MEKVPVRDWGISEERKSREHGFQGQQAFGGHS